MNWTPLLEAFLAIVATLATGLSLLIKKKVDLVEESVNHKDRYGRKETLYDLQHAQSIILNDMKEDLTSLIEVNQNDHIEIFKRISELQNKQPTE